MTDRLVLALVELRRDEFLAELQARLEKGIEPLAVLADCRTGMSLVGERFQRGECFLAELILSAELFKRAAAILEPYLLRTRPPQPLGKVILATLQGDVHDLGKNILATLLRAHGFEVHDLGVNVDPALVVGKVKEVRPDLVGFSALITTAYPSMRRAADLLAQAGLRDQVKLMVGGGVTNSMVREYVGADFQSTDAAEAVTYCLAAVNGR